MSDSFAPDQWMKGWLDLQRKFADNWQQASGGSGTSSAPLNQAFEMWSQLAGVGSSGNETLDRTVGAVRQMVAMMQSALEGAAGRSGISGTDWSSAFSSAFGGLDLQHNPVADALRRASGEGARGFEQLFGEFSKAAQPFSDAVKGVLQVPTFGYSREAQERRQKLALALTENQQQLDRYNRLMLDASRRALEKLELKLAEHSEPGRQLKSFRELYDCWIDAAEEGYAEVALSDEFRRAYGALVNAQMRVRQLVQQEIERSAAAVGMPTRGELDGVHRKLAEMKRQIADLEHARAVSRIEPVVDAVATPAAAVRRPKSASRASGKQARRVRLAAGAGSSIASAKVRTNGGAETRAVAGARTSPEKARRAVELPTAKVVRAERRVERAKPKRKETDPQPPKSELGSFAERLAALRKAASRGRKRGR